MSENFESKLTPAAREALEELVEDYRHQILLGATQSAASFTGEVQEISVRDIFDSVNRGSIKLRSTSLRPRELVPRVGMIVGISYAIMGFGYFIYQNIRMSLDFAEQIGLVAGILGLFLSLFSYWHGSREEAKILERPEARSLSFSRPDDSAVVIVQKWREIELAARNLVAARFGESSADKPVSVLIETLTRKEVLTKEDERRLRSLLSKRNQILHHAIELDPGELKTAIQEAEKILAKIASQQQAT